MKLHVLLILIMSGVMSTLAAQSPWQSVTAAGVTLEYRVLADAATLEAKLTGQTTGWVAVGFNPTSVMQNANFIIGYVSGTNAQIRDDWGTSNTSHASDTSLGGTSNVSLTTGTESGGSTMLHFTIPLNSGDQYDRPLAVNQSYQIILARGTADNYTGMHSDANYAQISLLAPVSLQDEYIIGANRILGNYPNPFNPSTTISYQAGTKQPSRLKIFNQKGQLVFKQELMPSKTGEGSIKWNGMDKQGKACPSGIYTVQLESPEGNSQHRITLMK